MFRNVFRLRQGFTNEHLHSLTKRRFLSDKSVETTSKVAQEAAGDNGLHIRRMYTPGKYERRILVWVGKYKSLAEVPQSVAYETMDLAKNRARIKICNYMILATIVGCLVMVLQGKAAAKRGETVMKMNMDWHESINKKE